MDESYARVPYLSISKMQVLGNCRKNISLTMRPAGDEPESDNKAVGRKLLGGMPRQFWCFGRAGNPQDDFSFGLAEFAEIWHLRCVTQSNLWRKGHDWLNVA